MVHCWLPGPGGFWFLESPYERDCYLGVPLESQTTGPQLTISWNLRVNTFSKCHPRPIFIWPYEDLKDLLARIILLNHQPPTPYQDVISLGGGDDDNRAVGISLRFPDLIQPMLHPRKWPRWRFQMFYVHPYLGKISSLINIFQGGWNHQLVTVGREIGKWIFMLHRCKGDRPKLAQVLELMSCYGWWF